MVYYRTDSEEKLHDIGYHKAARGFVAYGTDHEQRTRNREVLSVKISILCPPTLSDFGPLTNTLEGKHDN